jgi:ribosomal protein S21
MSDINIKRKKGESFEGMFRRFSRRVQQSGKILTARSNRFHEKDLTKNKRQEKKLRGLAIAEKIQYELRTGKITEQDLRRRKRRRR